MTHYIKSTTDDNKLLDYNYWALKLYHTKTARDYRRLSGFESLADFKTTIYLMLIEIDEQQGEKIRAIKSFGYVRQALLFKILTEINKLNKKQGSEVSYDDIPAKTKLAIGIEMEAG